MSSQWKGKSAVVCGATAGLGRAFAVELAQQQVQCLVLVARSEEALQAMQAELLDRFGNLKVVCLPADLRKKDQLDQACELLRSSGITVDLLIQAVGQSDRGRLVDLSSQRLSEMVDVNVLTSLHAIQCFRPLMQRISSGETGRSERATEETGRSVSATGETGRSAHATGETGRSAHATEETGRSVSATIVLVGSLASLFAPRFLGAYAIAKHGLAALAQQARLELAEEGIHVLLACPGPITRDDGGTRYDQLARDGDLPEAVRQPGGGAKVRGLDPQRLVRDILTAAATKQSRIIRPRKAQWLHWLSAISCSWGDRLLRKNSG